MKKKRLIHVIPIKDAEKHIDSVKCWCCPQPDWDCKDVIIHNAKDWKLYEDMRNEK